MNDLGYGYHISHHFKKFGLRRVFYILSSPRVYYQLKRGTQDGKVVDAFLSWYVAVFILAGALGLLAYREYLIDSIPKPVTNVTFKDVQGIDEFKEELEEIVDFLRHPKKYREMGAVVPRGVLLNGPPGTGKTLMAKALASEAGVDFLYKSGSEFEEMFVGVGSQRMRSLFSKARRHTPCIIFIDEIDTIASDRQSRNAAIYKDCLNQLLTEMDGFRDSENILVIGATNRYEYIDKAITRPGRFDRIIQVGYPDKKGRDEILKYYLSKVRYDPKKTDLDVVSRATTGYSGSQIKNLVNLAVLNAIKEDRSKAIHEDFEFAIDRITMGIGKKNMHFLQKDKLHTAYHEGGHTLANLYTAHTNPLHKVTILPRGQALG